MKKLKKETYQKRKLIKNSKKSPKARQSKFVILEKNCQNCVMKKLLAILVLGLLLCSLALAQSSLPKCKGINTFLWTDCFGTETFYGGKTYMGEYEMGVPNGQGTIILPDGEQYVGQW